MGDEELLSIGRFARLAGLSIGALAGTITSSASCLVPSAVDPHTAYRSYARAQLDDARLIARLRELELPLPEVRAILGADVLERRRLLAAHRSRLTALITRTQRQVHWLNQAIDHEEPLMSAPASVDVADRRQLAVDLFNHVWTLRWIRPLAARGRRDAPCGARPSRYHWGEVGGRSTSPAASGMLARLCRARPLRAALWHARRCLAACEEHGIGDWDIAFATRPWLGPCALAGDHAGADASVARRQSLRPTRRGRGP